MYIYNVIVQYTFTNDCTIYIYNVFTIYCTIYIYNVLILMSFG